MSEVQTLAPQPRVLTRESESERRAARLRVLLVASLIATAVFTGGLIPSLRSSWFFLPWGLLLCTAGVLAAGVAVSWFFKPNIWTIFGREMASLFLSPIAYLVLLGMVAVTGLNYWLMVYVLTSGRFEFAGEQNPMVVYIAGSLWFWIGFLILLPVLTMRLIAEEKRSGTIEVLLTAPVTEAELVLGKYFACMAFYPLLWLPSAIFLMALYGQQPFDYRPILACYVGVMSMGAMFVSLGLFFSSLTRNQIVAAIMAAAAMLLIFSFAWLEWSAESSANMRDWVEPLKYMAVLLQLNEMARGKLDIRYIILHLSVAAFALFLTARLLEARKGR